MWYDVRRAVYRLTVWALSSIYAWVVLSLIIGCMVELDVRLVILAAVASMISSTVVLLGLKGLDR